jgi:hypothetical protein
MSIAGVFTCVIQTRNAQGIEGGVQTRRGLHRPGPQGRGRSALRLPVGRLSGAPPTPFPAQRGCAHSFLITNCSLFIILLDYALKKPHSCWTGGICPKQKMKNWKPFVTR